MVPISSFAPLVQPYAPAAPFPMLEQAIRLAAVEFCERTRCWRHVVHRHIDVFNGGVGHGDIRIIPPYGTIFEFEFAYFNGKRLIPAQFSDLDIRPDDSNGPETGMPSYISQIRPGTLKMTPIPDESGSLHLSIFLKPVSLEDWDGPGYNDTADEDMNVLPEFLLVEQGEAISHGALSRLLSVPGQSFSDPAGASVYAASFMQKLDQRFDTNLRGQHRAPPRSRSHSF